MSTEYAASRVSHEGATFWLQKSADGKELVIEGATAAVLDAFTGAADGDRFIGPANADNALRPAQHPSVAEAAPVGFGDLGRHR